MLDNRQFETFHLQEPEAILNLRANSSQKCVSATRMRASRHSMSTPSDKEDGEERRIRRSTISESRKGKPLQFQERETVVNQRPIPLAKCVIFAHCHRQRKSLRLQNRETIVHLSSFEYNSVKVEDDSPW